MINFWYLLVELSVIIICYVMHCKHNIHMPEGSDFGMESWLAILYNNLDML